MKKIIYGTLYLSIMFLLISIIINYADSYPQTIIESADQIIIVSKNETIPNQTFLTDLENEANNYNIQIILQRISVEDGKKQYSLYSNQYIDHRNYPPIFTTSVYRDIKDYPIDFTSSFEMYLYGSDADVEAFIDSINNQYDVSDATNLEPNNNLALNIIIISILFCFVDLIVLIYLQFLNQKKRYLLMMEGYSKVAIHNYVNKKMNIFLITATLVTVVGYLLYSLIQNFLSVTLSVYLLITALVIVIIFNIYSYLVNQLIFNKIKGGKLVNGTYFSKNLKILMYCIKVIVVIMTVLTINQIINNYQYILQETDSINKYSAYQNIVTTNVYSPSNTMEIMDSGIDEAMISFYNLTVDKYNGTVALFYQNDIGPSLINENFFDYYSIIGSDGTAITADELATDKMTLLSPEKNQGTGLEEEYVESNIDVAYYQNGQSFKTTNLYALGNEEVVKDPLIMYAPNDIKNLDSSSQSNVATVAITGHAYFLTVPGSNQYATLKPLIDEAGAAQFILKTPQITSKLEINLASLQVELIVLIIEFCLWLVLLIMTIFIATYMYIKENQKKISIQKLEGERLTTIMKTQYLTIFITYAIVTVAAIILNIRFAIPITIFGFDIVMFNLLSRKLIFKNFTTAIKGEL